MLYSDRHGNPCPSPRDRRYRRPTRDPVGARPPQTDARRPSLGLFERDRDDAGCQGAAAGVDRALARQRGRSAWHGDVQPPAADQRAAADTGPGRRHRQGLPHRPAHGGARAARTPVRRPLLPPRLVGGGRAAGPGARPLRRRGSGAAQHRRHGPSCRRADGGAVRHGRGALRRLPQRYRRAHPSKACRPAPPMPARRSKGRWRSSRTGRGSSST